MTVEIERIVRYGERGWEVDAFYPISGGRTRLRSDGKWLWMFSEGKWNLQGMDADIPPKHPYVINVPQDEQRARKFFTTMLGGQPLEEYKKEHGSSE